MSRDKARAVVRATSALALPAALIALLYFGFYRSQYLQAAFPKAVVSINGAIQENGELPAGKLQFGDRARHWGSWSGSDENVGDLRFGPFRAPKILRFAIAGYPTTPGIRISLELADGSEESVVRLPEAGEGWKLRQHIVPPAWKGRPVFLRVSDSAKGPGGWISISEPIKGDLWTDSSDFLQALTCWALNGFFLGCIFLSAARYWSKTRVPMEWIALVSGATVALVGYALFWIFFCHANAGRISSAAVLGIALIGAWKFFYDKDSSSLPSSTLVLSISFLYLAILYLFLSSFDLYGLAANRFNEGLPPDNYLPYLVARSLLHGDSLRTPMGGWLVSDRPPLQTGWILLTQQLAAPLGFDGRTFSATSALWFQCLWITAAYGLLRAFHLRPLRACGWIAIMAMSGFFLQNTIFTWPKIAAGAFACGAFAFWFLPMRQLEKSFCFAIGGALAAAAWLTHGGVAFAFIPLVGWALSRVARGEWKGWLCAAAVFVTLVAPWSCFQKFYNPPANRLLKWHLAGQIEIDPRGTFETLRDSYFGQPISTLASGKLQNFQTQFSGDWLSLFDFSSHGAKARRHTEFYHFARALTWWWLWIFLLPVFLLRRSRAGPSPFSRIHRAFLSWIISTVIVWCLLIFIAGDAVIHQGPYTLELATFVLFSALLETTGRWTLALVGLLQSATFFSTWIVPNASVNGKIIGWPILILAVIGICAVFFREASREKRERAAI